MQIKDKPVAELTNLEYRACYRANYGMNGYMQGMLVSARAGEYGHAILLWDGPEDKMTSLIGWALLTPVNPDDIAGGTNYTLRRSKYTVQFWIKRQYRRKGHAKRLMFEVKKHDPRPHVIPHDEVSAELFSSFDVTVQQNSQSWLKRKPKVA